MRKEDLEVWSKKNPIEYWVFPKNLGENGRKFIAKIRVQISKHNPDRTTMAPVTYLNKDSEPQAHGEGMVNPWPHDYPFDEYNFYEVDRSHLINKNNSNTFYKKRNTRSRKFRKNTRARSLKKHFRR